MASNAYRFVTHWRFHATIVEIADIFEDTASLARWWPSVYLDVKVLEPGTGHGLGKVVDLLTKGYLPYTLRWKFRVVEENYPHGSRLEAIGDFVGTGIWTFVQDGDYADITYEWTVRAEKTLPNKQRRVPEGLQRRRYYPAPIAHRMGKADSFAYAFQSFLPLSNKHC